MEIQQTKEPNKQAAGAVVRDSGLIDEYDEHAKLLRSQTDVSIKDKVAMQDRFMRTGRRTRCAMTYTVRVC